MASKAVIGIAGMPGAGKAIVVEAARELGFGIVVMGDEVREETRRLKLEPTPENVGSVMVKMRQQSGPAVVAKRCIPKIKSLRHKAVIVDGIRSTYEVDELRRHFPGLKLIAVHSSPDTRFNRVFRRQRSDDPASWKTFLERDWRELRIGLGNVIACADVMVVNEGTLASFRSEVLKLLTDVV